MTENFPLLKEIDQQVNSDKLEWNQNAFQTLLTSNLPTTTVVYYAIDVGLRRLESSLYEPFWDATADALNDLSQYLFNLSANNDIDAYLYEAKCQLLMFASIAVIKMNTIRRRSALEAKMSCATVCLLLIEQSQSYENSSTKNQYTCCIHSMRLRFLKRLFLIGQWLPTLSASRLNDIQSNNERYIETMLEHLFSSVSLRDRINEFIENSLLSNNDNDATESDFVFIRRFPKYNLKTIENNSDLMHMAFVNILDSLNKNPSRKLVFCLWTLSCMIESDRVSLGVFDRCLTRDYYSSLPIDFEQQPITIESLTEQDIIVFLLLCAQQNVHLYSDESTLQPYSFYLSTNLCTQNQKNWWLTATEKTQSNEFVDNLATIRLYDERVAQFPPKLIILQTAKILFKAAQIAYEQHSTQTASSYEQYAIQYLQTAKAHHELDNSLRTQGYKSDKYFFFYSQNFIYQNPDVAKKLIDECEKLTRQCDELKLLPQPPKTSSPTKNQKDFHLSSILSPVLNDPSSSVNRSEILPNIDSTLFVTPPSIRSRDVDVQTIEQIPSPSVDPVVDESSIIEEETSLPPLQSLPPIVDMLFTHMNGVNQWINRFCISNDGIQNDINTIRDRLEKLNRSTSQMLFSNMKVFQSNSHENSGHFQPPPPPPPSSSLH